MARKDDAPAGDASARMGEGLDRSFGYSLASSIDSYVNAEPASRPAARFVLAVRLTRELLGVDHHADGNCEHVKVFGALLDAFDRRIDQVEGKLELVSLSQNR